MGDGKRDPLEITIKVPPVLCGQPHDGGWGEGIENIEKGFLRECVEKAAEQLAGRKFEEQDPLEIAIKVARSGDGRLTYGIVEGDGKMTYVDQSDMAGAMMRVAERKFEERKSQPLPPLARPLAVRGHDQPGESDARIGEQREDGAGQRAAVELVSASASGPSRMLNREYKRRD